MPHARGASRFATRVSTSALLEAAVKLRRRAWWGREVPIDVLADRMSTTRGALDKTRYDARCRLRLELAKAGFHLDGSRQGAT